jgi:hypothetical protein
MNRHLVNGLRFAAVVAILVFVFSYTPLSMMIRIPYDVFRSTNQKRALQGRSDYPQIAAACVTLARSLTADDGTTIEVADPRVPATLRSLAPCYIFANKKQVSLPFHGGFDHYGYVVRQSDTNPKQWTISYYDESPNEKVLATFSSD